MAAAPRPLTIRRTETRLVIKRGSARPLNVIRTRGRALVIQRFGIPGTGDSNLSTAPGLVRVGNELRINIDALPLAL